MVGVLRHRCALLFLFVLVLRLTPTISAQNVQAYKQTILAIQQQIETNHLDEARSLINAAAQEYPHDGGIENLLGVVEIQQGHKTEASRAFSAAILHNPRLASAYLNLSRIEMETAATDRSARAQALRLCRKVLEIEPGNDEANYQLANIRFWDKAYSLSLEYLHRLSPGARGQVGAEALLCADEAALADRDATESAANMLATHPDLTEQDVNTCLPGLRARRRADLIAKLLAAASSHQALSPAGLRILGLAQEADGKLELARATLESAFKEDSQSVLILEDLARVAKTAGDNEGALGYLAHARDLKPDDPKFAYEFAVICVRMGLLGEARKALAEAVRLAPDDPDYNLRMGLVVSFSEDPAQALPYLERYHELRPSDPEGLLALGTANYRAKDYDRALRWLRQALGSQKTAADAHFYIGRIAREVGDLDQAVKELKQSLVLHPRQPDALAELAQISTMKREFSEARAQFAEALRIDPDNYGANFGLLLLYARTNDARREQQSLRFEEIKNKKEERDRQMKRVIEIRRDGEPDHLDEKPNETGLSNESKKHGEKQ